MADDTRDQKLRLLGLVKDAIKRDEALRVQYEVGDKFRFVRDRLRALQEQLEKHIRVKEEEQKVAPGTLAADECLVFIYLYNTQGLLLQTWRNMLTPKLFYEYSINRPIYSERSHVESLIRSKANKVQHAFLTVAVKMKDVLSSGDKKDTVGNTVIRVKEGSLQFHRFVMLTHNEQDYELAESGELVKKN